MPNCYALKADYLRCTANVEVEGNVCGVHINVHARRVADSGEHQDGKCDAYLTTHRWCQHDAMPGLRLCGNHHQIQAHNLQKIRNEQIDQRLVNDLMNMDPQPTYIEVIDFMLADNTRDRNRKYRVSVWYYHRIAPMHEFRTFIDYWNWAIEGRVGPNPLLPPPLEIPIVVDVPPTPPPRALPMLGAIASDSQNVHTTAVTKQTNAGLVKLLETDVPKTHDTMRVLTEQWLAMKDVSFTQYLKVITDVNKWFMTKTCRTHKDRLYFHAMRGAVTMIMQTPDEIRTELFKRLWEECYESVEMCCDGHITRLCNVFVGFDDTFKPPVPFGEILQNKMSMIAELDVDEEEKRKQANVFFDEYDIPEPERVAWLEAF